MIDSGGHDYKELLAFQEEHLRLWETRVRASIMEDVAWYVRATNKPAADSTQKHYVARGQTIIELIRTWPVINPAVYPEPHKYPSQQDAVEALI